MLSDETFRGLLDSAPDGILVVGGDGRIVMVNAQLELLFGFDRAELIGQYPEILVPDAARADHVAQRSRFQTTPVSRPMGCGLALLGRRKDGTEFPVEISLSPHRTADGALTMAAVRDITERLHLEAERQALLDAARAERERERIAMDLHDGIIQSIFGVGLGLEIAAEEARGSAAADVIEKSIDQLNDVIRDIRAYIFELRPMSYDGDLADSVQHLVGAFRASSPIAIDLELDAGVAEVGDSVAVAVFQITQEALANARKHSQAKQVHVALRVRDACVHAEVVDDGVGFDAAAERAAEHRGLRNLASRAASIGGRLEIASTAGGGTTISLSVPLGTPGQDKRPAHS